MNTPKIRPYWHVDLKWLFGILAFLFLWGALLMNAFSTLTEKENATSVSNNVITNTIRSSGTDLTASIDQLKAQAVALPDGSEIAVPGMPWLKVTKEELLSRSNEELEAMAITQVTNPLYDEGLDRTAEKLTQDKTLQQSFKQQVGILGVISKQTHDVLLLASNVVLAVSVIWFAGLIYFSAGWGRLVSPGVVLMSVSPVGVAVGAVLEYLAGKNDSLLSFLPQSVMSSLAQAVDGTYRVAFFIGLGLLVAAGVGKLATKFVGSKKHSP